MISVTNGIDEEKQSYCMGITSKAIGTILGDIGNKIESLN